MRTLKSYDRVLMEEMGKFNESESKHLLSIAQNHSKFTEEIVKDLLERGADPNYSDNDGHTPLACAAVAKNTVLMKILLGAGADPNKPAHNGLLPIHYAAAGKNNGPAIKILAAAGADLDRSPDKMSALSLSVIAGRSRIQNVKALLNSGADPFTEFKNMKEIEDFFDGDLNWWKNRNEKVKRAIKVRNIFNK